MGNISDVYLVMKQNDWDEFLNVGKDLPDLGRFLDSADTTLLDGIALLIKWTDVKWYSEDAVLEWLKRELTLRPACLIRVGAETEDVEVIRYAESFQRQIDFYPEQYMRIKVEPVLYGSKVFA